MKIVHINTFAQGGAATAALRLHDELLEFKINSTFISLFDNSINIKNSIMLPFAQPTFWQKIRNKLHSPVMAEHIRERLIAKYQPKCEFLGTPLSDYRIEDIAEVKEADIINIHWVSNLINYPTFFKKLNKPIVWTIHDLSAFMGCFNYPIEVQNNTEMHELNNSFYLKKIEATKNYKQQIHIVAPSTWILNEAKKITPFAFLAYHHIPNGIDEQKLKYISTDEAREKLKIPNEACVFLFISDNIENNRKRFDRILELVAKISNDNVIFIAIGKNEVINEYKHINFVGKINSLEILNLYYAAANYFLMPSDEDNFPNVVLESLFCGTPVISNNVGGMKDIINPSNGFLLDNFDISQIIEISKKTIKKELLFDRLQIRNDVISKYSVSLMAKEYLTLYKNIL